MNEQQTNTELKLTIPGYFVGLTEKDQQVIEQLLRCFGNTRRRAYRLKQQGLKKGVIEKLLQTDHQLNSRYAKDAYYTIKDLPSHVTFGGLRNQRLREKKKISKEEYRNRRNAFLFSRGDRSKQGNLNLRLDIATMTLRVNTCDQKKRWIYPKVYLPKKYLNRYQALFDGSQPYAVTIRRRNNDQGFDVRIAITLQTAISTNAPQLLALDMNAGHTDFAVVNKHQGRVLAIGKVNHHETQYTRRGRRDTLLHKTVTKIGNLAKHYEAEVVFGHLNTRKYKVKSTKATRKVRQMPQYKFRQLLTDKLTQRGIQVTKRSEVYTSKLGQRLSTACGLDIHKCAAALFTLKVVNYPLFQQLKTLILSDKSGFLDEGDGSPRKTLFQRLLRELTAPHQNRRCFKSNRMMFWCAMKFLEEAGASSGSGGDSAIPGSWGLSFFESLRNSTFAYQSVKIC